MQGICNVCATVNLTHFTCVLPQMKAKVSTPGGFTLLVVRWGLLEIENTKGHGDRLGAKARVYCKASG